MPSIKDVRRLLWLRSYTWEESQVDDSALWDAERDGDAASQVDDLRAKGENEKAFGILVKLAEEGSAWASSGVAYCYHVGSGVTTNEGKAEAWYRKGALYGSQWAVLQYGRLVIERRDYAACEAMFSTNMFMNWPPSWFHIAYSHLQQSKTRADYMEALPLLERASEHGNPIAKHFLAQWMTWGKFGITNIPRGFKIKWDSTADILDVVAESDLARPWQKN